MNYYVLTESILLAIPILLIYLVIKLFRKTFTSFKNEGITVLMILYLTSFSYLLWFQPGPLFEQQPYNFTLFSTIRLYSNQLTHGFLPIRIIFVNLIGNLLITIPLGCWFSYRRVSKSKALVLALLIPIIIELGQYALHLLNYATRVVDIDDWLLNALGILLGYALTELFKKISRMQKKRNKTRLKASSYF